MKPLYLAFQKIHRPKNTFLTVSSVLFYKEKEINSLFILTNYDIFLIFAQICNFAGEGIKRTRYNDESS